MSREEGKGIRQFVNNKLRLIKEIFEALKDLDISKDEPEKELEMDEAQQEEIEQMPKKKYVIDASITGHGDFEKTVAEIRENGSVIILTSITIRELEALQIDASRKGLHARRLLAQAVENPDDFKNVLIDETLETPDDCIINYCAENKENVILLTSDKTMALKARMLEVEVRYFKHAPEDTEHEDNRQPLKTLGVAKSIRGKLVIDCFNTKRWNVMVSSDGLFYTDGTRELKVGDHVYIARIEKFDHATIFEHYHITSLREQHNAYLVYTKTIYNKRDIDLIPKGISRSFIRDFYKRHDSF